MLTTDSGRATEPQTRDLQGLISTESLRLYSEPAQADWRYQSDDLGDALDYLWAGRAPLAPATLPHHVYEDIASASESMLRAVRALLGDAQSRNHLIGISALSEVEASVLSHVGSHHAFPTARTDVVLADDGRAIITELNVTSRLGFLLEHDLMTRVLEDCEWFAKTVAKFALRSGVILAPLGQLLRALGHEPGASTICLCEGKDLPGADQRRLVNMIAEQLRRLQYPVVRATLTDLVCADGHIIHRDEGRVDVVYRMFDHRDAAAAGVYAELVGGHAGRLTLLDDLAGEILVTKLVLAMLTDERWLDRIGGAGAGDLARVLPWTRLLVGQKTEYRGRTVNLPGFVVANRETLVLKPGRGSRGTWVTIGREYTQDRWEKAVSTAMRSRIPWVVQEFLDPHTVTSVFKDPAGNAVSAEQVANYAALMVNGTCGGMIRREGPVGSRNLNTVQGARAVPVYRLPASG